MRRGSTDRSLLRELAAFIPVSLVVLASGACRTDPQRASVDGSGAELQPTSASYDADGSGTTRAAATVRRVSTGSDCDGSPMRAWCYGGFAASSISPDGSYISFIDWDTYNLAVQELQTGTVHRMTDHAGEMPEGQAGVSVFSRDGRRIVYGWQLSDRLQLRVAGFATDETGAPRPAEPKVLLNNPAFHPYYPYDWSPDGSLIVAKVYLTSDAGNTNQDQLALLSTTDGTYRALRTFDWREPTRAAFSPDGRYVAYDLPLDADSADRDVFVVSVDGEHEAKVVQNPAVDQLLGWSPDGSILFMSDRGGSPGVWRIPVRDGHAAGPAELVRADMWGITPLGFAGDRFYYGVSVDLSHLYTADVDLASGELTGRPVPIDEPSRTGRVWGWGWSPNGRYFATASRPPRSVGTLIVIRDDGGKEVKSFHLDLNGRYGFLRWHPDGKSLIAFARDGKGRNGLQRIDLETGSYTTIVRSDQLDKPIRPSGVFAMSPDGRTLWFATVDYQPEQWRFDLVAYDVESGDQRPITPAEWRTQTMPASVGVAVSPDGSRLAIVAPNDSGQQCVGILPVGGGPFTPAACMDERLVGGVEWTPDGRSLVFTTSGGQSFRPWIVPADGGHVRPLALGEGFGTGARLILDPSGGRLAFGFIDQRDEVWVMEGLGRGRIAASGSAK